VQTHHQTVNTIAVRKEFLLGGVLYHGRPRDEMAFYLDGRGERHVTYHATLSADGSGWFGLNVTVTIAFDFKKAEEFYWNVWKGPYEAGLPEPFEDEGN
jgi:hypothetical protein